MKACQNNNIRHTINERQLPKTERKYKTIKVSRNIGTDNTRHFSQKYIDNSTGIALSEGDKIRDFILMGLPTKEQNEYYEKYWNKIELCTNYDVSSFMRDYLSVKQQAIMV